MIFLDLILTLFIYLTFPVIYVAKKGKVERKKAKKFALINSIVGAIFFIILRIAIDPEGSPVTTFAPCVLYYFIGKAILTDKFYVENRANDNKDFINDSSDVIEYNTENEEGSDENEE